MAAASSVKLASFEARLKAIEAKEKGYAEQEAELKTIVAKCAELDAVLSWPAFVLNRASGCYHASGQHGRLPRMRDAARTPCGWRFSSETGDLVDVMPNDVQASHICSRCLPRLRQERLAGGGPPPSDGSCES